MTLEQLLPLLVPLIVLQLALLAIGLFDLTRAERRVKGGNKWVWAVIIVVGGIIGPVVYFLVGREDV